MTVPIIDAVFGGQNDSEPGIHAFAQANDDARAVIEFVHEYEVPGSA